MPTTIQPLERLEGSIAIPSEMRTAEWARVDQWTRERAFYMAGVARVEILQEMRDLVKESATGAEGEFALRKRWEAFLDGVDYKPEAGQEGGIKDLRSLARFNVALRTNRALMNGWALRENGMRPGPMQSQPCWELVRFQEKKAPRDWVDRFTRAGGELYDGRLIAPKTSPVWEDLGRVDLFEDALGVNHPPFAWGSGMNWKGVGSREAMRLGVMTKGQIREQRASAVPGMPVASPNESLEAAPAVRDEDLREQLADDLNGFAEWRATGEGDAPVLVFTDPNGSRGMSPEGLERVYSQSLPKDFHGDVPGGLFQREAVLDFGEDPQKFAANPNRDAWDDLARAVGRIAGPVRKREILRTMADRDGADWIGALVKSDLWRLALGTDNQAARAVLILRAILTIL